MSMPRIAILSPMTALSKREKERLHEDYLHLGLTHADEGAFTGRYPLTVPEGYIFVMGDHRSVSKDSRSPDVGFVPLESVTGRVVFRISPAGRIGTVR